MTKKAIFEAVVELIKDEVSEEVLAKVSDILKPKVGGGKSTPEDYTVFDAEGNPVYIFCTVHKKWEPLVDDEGELLFKEDKNSKNGYRRYCIAGDKQWQARAKAFKATKEAVMGDLLEGEITNDEAKKLIEEAEAERAEPFTREDNLGYDERPELTA